MNVTLRYALYISVQQLRPRLGAVGHSGIGYHPTQPPESLSGKSCVTRPRSRGDTPPGGRWFPDEQAGDGRSFPEIRLRQICSSSVAGYPPAGCGRRTPGWGRTATSLGRLTSERATRCSVASAHTRRNSQVGLYRGKLETAQHRLLEVRYVADLIEPTAVGEGLIGGVQRGKLVQNTLACVG